MKATPLVVFIIEVLAVVAGQVLVKHAVEQSQQLGFRNRRVLAFLCGGIAAMAVSFFLTLGLLQHFDLSYFFPLQASTTILIVVFAAVFLRERLSLQLLAGSVLITAGIVLVSLS
ncbi:MAG: EamA family transporter [Verrucomicrobia bacterium]|nr:EamA family transporter [Verrucomicrobiota bacterium]